MDLLARCQRGGGDTAAAVTHSSLSLFLSLIRFLTPRWRETRAGACVWAFQSAVLTSDSCLRDLHEMIEVEQEHAI